MNYILENDEKCVITLSIFLLNTSIKWKVLKIGLRVFENNEIAPSIQKWSSTFSKAYWMIDSHSFNVTYYHKRMLFPLSCQQIIRGRAYDMKIMLRL